MIKSENGKTFHVHDLITIIITVKVIQHETYGCTLEYYSPK